MLLLVEANTAETFPLLSTFFKGSYLDYTPAWYQKTGYILVQTMIINSVMPVVS